MLVSESMDANVIRISQSWSEFLVLLVVQHSHVVSEHVIDQVSVVRINSLVNIVLVVSSIHGIPAEIIFIEIIRLNKHVIQRTNIDVWADEASLSIQEFLNVGEYNLGVILWFETHEFSHSIEERLCRNNNIRAFELTTCIKSICWNGLISSVVIIIDYNFS